MLRSSVIPTRLTIVSPDTPSLLPGLAPRFPLLTDHASSGSAGFSDRHPAHGQAQADLGSRKRLRGLRRGDGLHARVGHGEEDAAEIVLQANDPARGTEEYEHGTDDPKMGWRRNPQEGREWNVAKKSIEETKIGEVERSVRGTFIDYLW